MRDFSKYFTPPLAPADRQRLAQALRLDASPWVLEESCGGQALRRWSSLSGPCWGKPGSGAHEFDFAALGPFLNCAPFRESRDLWRDLLPHPFRSQPPGASESQVLASVWATTESVLSTFELSLVWAGDEATGVPLLFHFVRRRCIRLGTAESLKEIGKKCLSGEWTTKDLHGHFATRTGFFHWESTANPGHPLDRFAQILRNALPADISALTPDSDRPRTML